MATKWQHITITIPEAYTPDERDAIGQELVDFIRSRVQDKNTDKNNQGLAGYSKEYIKSLNFKNAGKSPGDVNFTQSGDTLAALDVLSSKPGEIVIGWENGTEENAIADGNIRGTYGHAKPVGPKRDILGLTKSDLNRILDQYPLDNPDELDSQINQYLASVDISEGDSSE